MSAANELTLARLLVAGAWAQDYLRLGLTALVVALGVALGAAVHTLNFSAAKELSLAIRSLAGEADVSIRGGFSGFSEALYPRLAVQPEIAAASPALEVTAKLAGRSERLRIIGLDPMRALIIQPALLGDASERIGDLLRDDTIMLSTSASQELGLGAGDTLAVQVGLQTRSLRVVAVLPVNDALRQPLALMDIASAQWVFERIGQLTRIDLRLRSGNDPDVTRKRLETLLPAGVRAVEPDLTARQSIALSRAYRVNLNMLALVSLFTGAVLVFSTQVLALLRRRTHFALLRALGMTKAQLTMILAAEAGILGVLGSTIGIALGVLAAHLALAYAGADLGAGFFHGISARITFDPIGLGAIAGAGIGACMLGGALPAREAANAAPAQALRAGSEQYAPDKPPRPIPGLLVLAAGLGLLVLPAIDELPVFGYIAIACFLIGAILLMPGYAYGALSAVPPTHSTALHLAIAQMRGASRYAGISLATILASFSLAVAMLIMIHAFRHSLDAWLHTVLPADLYARAGTGNSTWLDPDVQALIRATPGVRRVLFSRHQSLQLDPARPLVTLIARDMDPGQPEALPLIAPQRLPVDGTIPVWVSEAMQSIYGMDVGQRLTLPIAGVHVEVTVAGIWRDYVRQGGAVLINRADYVRISVDRLANDAWIWLEPGQQVAQATLALRQSLAVGPELEISEPGPIRTRSLAIFDRTFSVTYGLQFAALAIALFGVGVGLSAQALARRAEFGMLKHLGMTRRELARVLAIEGAVLGGLGALAGLVTGVAMSYVLIHVVNRQSFHWSMDIYWPTFELAFISILLIASCAVTAALGARHALGHDAIRAVREDW